MNISLSLVNEMRDRRDKFFDTSQGGRLKNHPEYLLLQTVYMSGQLDQYEADYQRWHKGQEDEDCTA